MATAPGRASRSFAVAVLAASMLATCAGQDPEAIVVDLDGAPQYPLFDHTVTWTGDEAFVIGGAGGDMNDGELVVDPLRWTPDGGFESIAAPPGPPRNRHAAVWTGTELLIWSGTSAPFGVADGLLASTAAYDPTTDAWRELADSPEGLARVWADAVMVGRFAVFAGGDGPSVNGLPAAVYDTENDAWSELVFGAGTIAVAADGEQGYLLGFDDDHELLVGELSVGSGGVLEIGGAGAGIPDGEAAAQWADADVAVVAGSLVIVARTAERTFVKAEGSEAWQAYDLDRGGFGGAVPQAGVEVVDDRIVWGDPNGLIWFDLDGTFTETRLDSRHSCAAMAGAVSIGTELLTVGGDCSSIDNDGREELLFGSALISFPPASADGS